ncbi:MAG: hypothetical protein RID07_05885, partial [Lacipirellulaceae bacterium]
LGSLDELHVLLRLAEQETPRPQVTIALSPSSANDAKIERKPFGHPDPAPSVAPTAARVEPYQPQHEL